MAELDNFRNYSTRINETVKFVAIGVIATDFAILTLKDEFFKTRLVSIKEIIVWSLLFCILSIVFDYINALAGFFNSYYKIRRNIAEEQKGLKIFYVSGYVCFYLKQVFVVIASVLLILSFMKTVLN